MAAVTIVPADLASLADIPHEKALVMIEDAMAMAAMIAPCIDRPDFDYEAAARAIIRGAILRWHEAGNGAISTVQTSIDDFNRSQTYDTKQNRRGMFWPSEIQQLQKLCETSRSTAFAIDTTGGTYLTHADTCAVTFGANYCDCGADLTGGFPLFGAT